MLFYETKLSANNKLSCASCHRQELAFTDGRAFSPGVDQIPTTRNAMSLQNLLWVRQLFWDGRASGLEEQALTPLTNTHEMGQSMLNSAAKLRRISGYPALFKAAFGNDTITKEKIVKAIAQFERTLISDHSRYDGYLQGSYQPSQAETDGMNLFMTDPQPGKGIRGAGCAHCHGGPKLFLEQFHNNGLDSAPIDPGRAAVTGMAADKGRFRVPTLRNIALTAPYMHDGRFATLREVLDHYSDHIAEGPTLSPQLRQASNTTGGHALALSDTEKRSVISFLLMLTDSTFIKDPRYADPHSYKTREKTKTGETKAQVSKTGSQDQGQSPALETQSSKRGPQNPTLKILPAKHYPQKSMAHKLIKLIKSVNA